jgi:hypothetical protein
MINDVLHDGEDTRGSSFDVVILSSVEWPNERVTIRVEVDNKSQIILLKLQESAHCLSFWLSEGAKSRKEFRAWVSSLFSCIIKFPVDCVISV